MPPEIVRFLQANTCATICCTDEEHLPYCFNSFFGFDSKHFLLHYKTADSSHHALLMKTNRVVAGTVVPDKLDPLAIQGIQFTGYLLQADDVLVGGSGEIYHERYPFALTMPGTLCTIRLTEIKMTDNTKGFGTKIKWKVP